MRPKTLIIIRKKEGVESHGFLSKPGLGREFHIDLCFQNVALKIPKAARIPSAKSHRLRGDCISKLIVLS